MKKIILACIILFCFCYSVKAQLSTEETPYSWEKGKVEININSIPITFLPNLDLETLYEEDLENENTSTPYRFGFSHDVKLSLSNSGIWERTSDGGRLWTMRIYSPDALSLNLLYDQFWLPEGAKFFLYSEDMKQHIGAFTSQNNKGNRENMKGFATGFLFTNSIVLEYYEPRGVDEVGVISISNIISGYRGVYNNTRDPGDPPSLLDCFEDVNCHNLPQEKDAVALMVMSVYSCSGALLNTTANDNRPVFLTADHCFVNIPTEEWMFYWNYENPCYYTFNVIPDSKKSTVGATILARSDITDFMLLEIEDPLKNPNVTVYYLGWDRSGDTSEYGYCIHHPGNPYYPALSLKVLPKKIAFAYLDIVVYSEELFWSMSNSTYTYSPENTHWHVIFGIGEVYQGASGSPLLNQDKRVIGQLHGGDILWCKYFFNKPPPGFHVNNFYGRFDLSWEGDDPSSRLKDWLDPQNTGHIFIDGTFGCRNVYANKTITTNTDIAGCDILNIYDVTITNNATVNITAEEAIIINADFHATPGTNVWIRIEESGSKSSNSTLLTNFGDKFEEPDLQLKVSSKESNIGITPNIKLHPNPNNGTFNIDANFPLSDIANFKVINLLGIPIYETQNITSNTVQLQNSVSGQFFVIMILKDGSVLTQRMVIQK